MTTGDSLSVYNGFLLGFIQYTCTCTRIVSIVTYSLVWIDTIYYVHVHV